MSCRGNISSCFSGDGRSMSKLDRFLVSGGLIDGWGIVGQLVNNCWFENKDFPGFVEKEWLALCVVGRSDFILKEKLRLIKGRLRMWNVEVFSHFNMELEEANDTINEMDELLAYCKEEEVTGIVARRSKKLGILWRRLDINENMLIQKSRKLWIIDGNLNSRYLHNIIKGRWRRNFIGVIHSDRGTLFSVDEVKEEVRRNFCCKFLEPELDRPLLEGVDLNVFF
ncbi:hypothetical protein KIW84_066372 [Lathyrus oleraceus]|nr:hypothetical protein KIW84_066372 [Pisum sativum]